MSSTTPSTVSVAPAASARFLASLHYWSVKLLVAAFVILTLVIALAAVAGASPFDGI
jgi:hypothetical protein